MSRRVLLVLALVSCVPDVPASNPYDPDVPAEQQQRATLSGQVLGSAVDDSALQPLTGATVEIEGPSEPTNNPIETKADGAFNFGELIPGRYSLEVSHPQHLRHIRDLVLEPGDQRQLEVVLERGVVIDEEAHLKGTARKSTELNRPDDLQDHAGIVVEVEGRGIRTVTNRDGHFDLWLAAGTHTLSFAAPDHVTARREDIEASAGEITAVESVVLAANPGTLSGTVMRRTCEANADDEEELAGEGAVVTLIGTSHTSVAAADGTFVITGVPAGVYTVRASLDGHASDELTGLVLRGGETVELQEPLLLLSAKGSVSGRVLLAGESDHSGSFVQLTGTGFVGVTGSDGSFLLSGVCAGSGYELRASHDGFLASSVGGIEVGANESTAVDNLELARSFGGLTLNNGAPFTNTTSIPCTLEAPAGTTQMRRAESMDALMAAAWGTYVYEDTCELSADEGTKTLYAQFSDGNTPSGILQDSVILDQTPPASPSLVIEDGDAYSRDDDGSVLLTLAANDLPAAGADTASGLARMKLLNHDLQDGSATAPADPADAAWDAAGELPYVRVFGHSLLRPSVDEEKEVWVRFGDGADNWSGPIAARVILDRDAPDENSIVISNNGSGYVSSSTVTLILSTNDENPGVQMRLSNASGFVGASFRPFTPSVTWFLEPGEGTRQVWVEFADAAGNVASSGPAQIDVDLTAPTGSLSLDGGGDVTSSVNVSATLVHPVDTVAYALGDNLLDCANASYTTQDLVTGTTQTTTSYALPSGDGLKVVVACLKDQAGNTAQASDTITLDQTAPTGSLTLSPASITNVAPVEVRLTYTGASEMCLWGDIVDGSNDSCVSNGWEQVSSGEVVNLTWAADGSLDGDKTINVKFRDDVGWESVVASAAITLDTQPPAIGTVEVTGTIGSGVSSTQWTRTAAVNVALYNWLDANGVTEMQVAHDSGFAGASWQPLADSFSWILSAGDGSKEVWVRVRDAAGNVSGAASATIGLDQTPPAGSVRIVGTIKDGISSTVLTGTDTVTLELSASDGAAGSGSLEMLVSGDFSAVFKDVWSPVSDAETVTLTAAAPASGEHKAVTAQFRDAAGNESMVTAASILLDQEGPSLATSSVSIDDGALFTGSVSVTLSLIAADAYEMRVSVVDDTFTGVPWVPFASTAAVLLPAGDCATADCKAVWVDFRDEAGHALTGAVSDTITLDTTPPSAPRIGIAPYVTTESSVSMSLTVEAADDYGFVYELLGGQYGSWTQVASAAPWSFSLPREGTHSLGIRAVDPAGNASAADYLSVTYDATAPLPPLNVRAVERDESIRVLWDADASSDVAGYRIWYGAANGTAPTIPDEINELSGTFANEDFSPIDVGLVESFTLTGLVNDFPLWIVVEAYDGASVGGPNRSYSNLLTVMANPISLVWLGEVDTGLAEDAGFDLWDSYAAVAHSDGLEVYALEPATNPALTSSNAAFSHTGEVFAFGRYAYVTGPGEAGFRPADISNPHSASDYLLSFSTLFEEGVAIRPYGKYLYALYLETAPNTYYLERFAFNDANDDDVIRRSPVQRVDPGSFGWKDMAISGGRATLVGLYNIKVIDIADDNVAPQDNGYALTRTDHNICSNPATVEAFYNDAFVGCDNDGGFFVLDLSKPVDGAIVGARLGLTCIDLVVRGSLAYCAGGSGSDDVVVLSVADKSNPKVIGRYNYKDPALPSYDANFTGVRLKGHQLWAYDAGSGKLIGLEVTRPNFMEARGNAAPLVDLVGTNNFHVSPYGSTAVVAGGYANVLDVTNPDDPVSLGVAYLGGDKSRVFTRRNEAAFAGTGSAPRMLDTLNLSDPTSITVSASPTMDLGSNNVAWDLLPWGNVLFVLVGHTNPAQAAVQSWDITDSSSPTMIQQLDLGGSVDQMDGGSMTADGYYLYVAMADQLFVVRRSPASSMSAVAVTSGDDTLSVSGSDVVYSNGHVWAVNRESSNYSLVTWDVTSPASPLRLSDTVPEQAIELGVSDDLLITGCADSTLVRWPAVPGALPAPRLALDGFGSRHALQIAGPEVYSLDIYGGFTILWMRR